MEVQDLLAADVVLAFEVSNFVPKLVDRDSDGLVLEGPRQFLIALFQ